MASQDYLRSACITSRYCLSRSRGRILRRKKTHLLASWAAFSLIRKKKNYEKNRQIRSAVNRRKVISIILSSSTLNRNETCFDVRRALFVVACNRDVTSSTTQKYNKDLQVQIFGRLLSSCEGQCQTTSP